MNELSKSLQEYLDDRRVEISQKMANDICRFVIKNLFHILLKEGEYRLPKGFGSFKLLNKTARNFIMPDGKKIRKENISAIKYFPGTYIKSKFKVINQAK